MCYSNSSTSSNVELGKTYQKKIDLLPPNNPIYCANGFTFPEWPIITVDDNIQIMKWGLIPHWFRSENTHEIANKTLNARIESLAEKASFKSLTQGKRCIIPSTGFFEYQHQGKARNPFFIFPKDDSVFSMAGLYDEWLNPISGLPTLSFTIITTTANSLMEEIHNSKKRMPLILSPNQIEAYLQAEKPIEKYDMIHENKMDAHRIDKKIIQSNNYNIPEVQQCYVDNIGQQISLF